MALKLTKVLKSREGWKGRAAKLQEDKRKLEDRVRYLEERNRQLKEAASEAKKILLTPSR